jgi:hypothetical protein
VRVAAGIAFHVLVAVVATWPMLLTPMTRLVGHEDVEVWNHAWGAWWFWDSLSHGRLPWSTQLLYAPDGGTLFYIDPIGASLSAPLVPLVGLVGAWNALVFGYVALASVGAGALARAVGATGSASRVASAAVACSPYLVSEVHNGVSEAMGVGWALLALAAAFRAVDEHRPRRWVLLGLAMGLCLVGTHYYGLSAALAMCPLAARHWRRLPWFALAAGLAALLWAPVASLVHASVTDPASLVFRGTDTGAGDLFAHNAVDPRTLLWPGSFQSVDLVAQGEAFRHSSYLGFVVLGLALWSRHGLVLAAAAVPAIMSLGPWVWWGDHWVRTADGGRIQLPFRLLMELLPSAAVTHPQRLAATALGLLAAAAAVAASRLPPRAVWGIAPLVALEGLLVGPAPWPIARAPELDLTAHAALEGPGIVLDLPAEVGNTMATSRYFAYQAASGLPVPWRPDARAGTSALVASPVYQLLAVPSMHTREHARSFKDMTSRLLRIDVADLPLRDVRWIVLHREMERGTEGTELVEERLRSWYGDPGERGAHLVWDLKDVKHRVVPLEPE